LIVSASVVIKRSNLLALGWLTINGGTTSPILVDIVAEVDNIVGILVYNRAGISRKETATILVRTLCCSIAVLLGVVGARINGESLSRDIGCPLARGGLCLSDWTLVVRLSAVCELVRIRRAGRETGRFDLFVSKSLSEYGEVQPTLTVQSTSAPVRA
jgi:hypothetical protein